MTNLQKRFLSSIGFIFLFIPVYFLKEKAFIGLGILFCIFIFYEFMHMINIKKFTQKSVFFSIFCILSSLFIFTSYNAAILSKFLSLFVILNILIEISLKTILFQKKTKLMQLIKCFFFSSLPAIIFMLCFSLKDSLQFIYLMCFLIISTDIFGFFFGQKFGKNQLSKLSPKKTWEGFILSLIPSLAIIFIFNQIYPLPLYYFLIFTCVPITSLLGDLHESLIKRKFNIKDSSQAIPGHGGFYDRFDGFILTLPFVYLFISL